MRQIHVNEDLSGKTLTGPALQSTFRNCTLDKTVFIGDWRGSDYFNCRGAADWSRAQTYGSLWQGRAKALAGSTFAQDIGWFHQQPMAEIARQGSQRFTGATRTALEGVADYVDADPLSSWIPAMDKSWKDTGTSLTDISGKLTVVFGDYPIIQKKLSHISHLFIDKGIRTVPTPPLTSDITDREGKVVFTFDPLAVVHLTGRVEMLEWLTGELEKETGHPWSGFIYYLMPPVVEMFPRKVKPNYWLTAGLEGY